MSDEEEYTIGIRYPKCAKVNCKNSVKYGGYPGAFSGELYCYDHRGFYSRRCEFVNLLLDEDDNFVV